MCLECGSVVADKSRIEKLPTSKRIKDPATDGESRVCNVYSSLHPKVKEDKEDLHFGLYMVVNQIK